MPQLTLASILKQHPAAKVSKTKRCVTEYSVDGQIFNNLEQLQLYLNQPSQPFLPVSPETELCTTQLPSGDSLTGSSTSAFENFVANGLPHTNFDEALETRVAEAITAEPPTLDNISTHPSKGLFKRALETTRQISIERRTNTDYAEYSFSRVEFLLKTLVTSPFQAVAKIMLATGLRVSSLAAISTPTLPTINDQLAIPSQKLINQYKGKGLTPTRPLLETVAHTLIPVSEIQKLWTDWDLATFFKAYPRPETNRQCLNTFRSSAFYGLVGNINGLRHVYYQSLVFLGLMEHPKYEGLINSRTYYLNWRIVP